MSNTERVNNKLSLLLVKNAVDQPSHAKTIITCYDQIVDKYIHNLHLAQKRCSDICPWTLSYYPSKTFRNARCFKNWEIEFGYFQVSAAHV